MNSFEDVLLIDTLVVGQLHTNCYIVIDREKREGAVIDPGGDADFILQTIRTHNVSIKWIINTHGHIDHIGANADLKKETKAKIMIHLNDEPMLKDPELNGAVWLGIPFNSCDADVLIDDSCPITIGTQEFQVIHTPGHSPGSITLYRKGLIFSGDLLFKGGIGRWDLPGGDKQQLITSVEHILKLPSSTRVYPGHGPTTTIGRENIELTSIC